MYKTQQALIAQLKAGRNVHFSSVKEASIKEYAGEANDANKIREVIPAILVMHIDSNPAGLEPKYVFDLLICTESQSFERETNSNTNLQLAQQVVDYFDKEDYCSWTYLNEPYTIDRDAITANTILQDDRFTIVSVRLEIKNML